MRVLLVVTILLALFVGHQEQEFFETSEYSFSFPRSFEATPNPGELPPASVPPCAYGFSSCVYYDGGGFEGSTFISAGVAIRTPALDEESCESTEGNFAIVERPRRETLGGVDYFVFEASEAAMNKVARDFVYRTWRAGSCFELVSRIATTNLGVYEPGTVAEFTAPQASKLRDVMRGVISSVEFRQ